MSRVRVPSPAYSLHFAVARRTLHGSVLSLDTCMARSNQRRPKRAADAGRPAASPHDRQPAALTSHATSAVERRQVWLVSFVLALVSTGIYAPTVVVPYDFVAYDDNFYLIDEPNINRGLSLDSIQWAFTQVVGGNYHPIAVLSHMLDCQLYGLAPRGHHLTSALLHVVNGVLLFLILQRTTSALWPSALVAALFAWHPLRVESVAWVSERKDVLSTFFMLLALGAYTRYAARRSWLFYGATLLAFALGIMSKPMLVTFPFVLLLVDAWPLGRIARLPHTRQDFLPASMRRILAEKIPLLAISLLAIRATIWAQSKHGAIVEVPLIDRLSNAVVSYYAYLATAFYPFPLYVPYLFIERDVPRVVVACGAIGLVVATVVAVLAIRRRPYITTGWLWYLGTLIPVIGIVQVGEQSMADRYTYIPLIGIAVIVAWLLNEIAARGVNWRRAIAATSGTALASLVVLACIQVTYWRDTRTLFAHTLKYSPYSHAARIALSAQAIYDNNYPQALIEARHALEIAPDSRFALSTVARSLARTGQTSAAIVAYQAAIDGNPEVPMLLVELARILATCEDERYRSGPDAVRITLVARQRFGGQNPMVLDTLAAAYAESGEWNAAETTATSALKMARQLVADGYPEVQPLVDGLEARLKLYRQRRPYRVPLGVWDYLAPPKKG